MDVSLGTLIGQATTFLVLVLVTMKFVWPPLTQAMEERRQKIAEGLAQSDEAEKALAKAEAEAEQVIRDARARAGEIIDQAGKRGNELIEQAKQDAISERDRQVAAQPRVRDRDQRLDPCEQLACVLEHLHRRCDRARDRRAHSPSFLRVALGQFHRGVELAVRSGVAVSKREHLIPHPSEP